MQCNPEAANIMSCSQQDCQVQLQVRVCDPSDGLITSSVTLWATAKAEKTMLATQNQGVGRMKTP